MSRRTPLLLLLLTSLALTCYFLLRPDDGDDADDGSDITVRIRNGVRRNAESDDQPGPDPCSSGEMDETLSERELEQDESEPVSTVEPLSEEVPPLENEFVQDEIEESAPVETDTSLLEEGDEGLILLGESPSGGSEEGYVKILHGPGGNPMTESEFVARPVSR